jgi:hypothetical protein
MVFNGCVGIRKALKAVSQMLYVRARDHRRSSLRFSYNAGSARLVDGTTSNYPGSLMQVECGFLFWGDRIR